MLLVLWALQEHSQICPAAEARWVVARCRHSTSHQQGPLATATTLHMHRDIHVYAAEAALIAELPRAPDWKMGLLHVCPVTTKRISPIHQPVHIN